MAAEAEAAVGAADADMALVAVLKSWAEDDFCIVIVCECVIEIIGSSR